MYVYGNKGMVKLFFGSEPTKEIHLSICSSKQVFGICNFLVLRKTVNSFVKVSNMHLVYNSLGPSVCQFCYGEHRVLPTRQLLQIES